MKDLLNIFSTWRSKLKISETDGARNYAKEQTARQRAAENISAPA